jgi:hypothetical protein
MFSSHVDIPRNLTTKKELDPTMMTIPTMKKRNGNQESLVDARKSGI